MYARNGLTRAFIVCKYKYARKTNEGGVLCSWGDHKICYSISFKFDLQHQKYTVRLYTLLGVFELVAGCQV